VRRERVIHRGQPLLGIGGHHMRLDRLFEIVLFHWGKILDGELTPRVIEMDRHRLPEDGKALTQRHDLLLMKPQE